MSRLSGTTSLVVPWTAAVIFWGVIVDEYCVLEMKNGRNERVFLWHDNLVVRKTSVDGQV